MKKRVYIAGPMTGVLEYNFPAFDEAKRCWEDADCEVISPADITRRVWFEAFGRQFDPAVDKCDYGDPLLVEMMARDLDACARCHLVAVLPGWEKSKGALREVAVAMNHGAELYNAVTFTPLDMRVVLHAEPTGETVLEEAQRLVFGDRQAAYGHPFDDYERTSRMWEGLLGLPEGFIGPRKAVLMMALVKVSREVNAHKRDNCTDGAGYFACAQLVAEREAEIEAASRFDAEKALAFLRRNREERAEVERIDREGVA